MSTTYAEICQFISDAGMDILTDESSNDDARACYYLSVLGTSFKVFIGLEDDGRLIQIHAYPRSHELAGASPTAWELVHELLNEFNKDIRYGRWAIDDDGDARVHFSLFIEDAPFTRRQLVRIHFLLCDLMIYQAQLLQIQSKLDHRVPRRLFGLTAAAIQTVIDHPSEIDIIVQAIHATEQQAHQLHDVIGKVFVVPELSTYPSDGEVGEEGGEDTGAQPSEDSEQAAVSREQKVTGRCSRRISPLH